MINLILITLMIGAVEKTINSLLFGPPTSYKDLMRGVIFNIAMISLEYGMVLIVLDLELMTHELMCSIIKFERFVLIVWEMFHINPL